MNIKYLRYNIFIYTIQAIIENGYLYIDPANLMHRFCASDCRYTSSKHTGGVLTRLTTVRLNSITWAIIRILSGNQY